MKKTIITQEYLQIVRYELPTKLRWFSVLSAVVLLFILTKTGVEAGIYWLISSVILFFWLQVNVLMILWQLFGKEVITIGHGKMNIRHSWYKLSINTSYDIVYIKDLDISTKLRRGQLHFTYKGKNVYFGEAIDAEIAENFILELQHNSFFGDSNFGRKRLESPNRIKIFTIKKNE